MSVNRFQSHILVLPEDDANRQLAGGFILALSPAVSNRIHVLPVAGGWSAACNHFVSDEVPGMERYQNRMLVLMIDFDRKHDRLQTVKSRIPTHLTHRVFVLGAWTRPEDLKAAKLGSYEAIGKALADECRTGTDTLWSHNLLRHNAAELERLRGHVRPILFEPIS